jgi:predicted secreted Zn-dependent protease
MIRALYSGLLFFASQNSIAEVKASLDYVYYTASAEAGGSLAAILKHSTAVRLHGDEYFGRPSWRVTWHFHWNANSIGDCQITKLPR